jgi:hypothetical protein
MRKILFLMLIPGLGIISLGASIQHPVAKPLADCRAELQKCNRGLRWDSQASEDCTTQFYVCRAANEARNPFQGCDGERCKRDLPPRPIKGANPKPDKDDKPKPKPRSYSTAPLWKNIGTMLPVGAPAVAPRTSGASSGTPASLLPASVIWRRAK